MLIRKTAKIIELGRDVDGTLSDYYIFQINLVPHWSSELKKHFHSKQKKSQFKESLKIINVLSGKERILLHTHSSL